MKILFCEQGSGEWVSARAGLVTASEVDALVTSKFEARTGEGPKTYLYKKLCERVIGFSGSSGGTFSMEQGKIGESMGIPWYEFEHNVNVKRVGFCVSDDGKIGCSPDGLVGEDGGVELKCPAPEKHMAYLLDQKTPNEYLPQVHMSMYVTGRKWWDFVSYNPHLPKLVVRVVRDEAICAALDKVLKDFVAKLDDAEKRLRGMMESKMRGRAD